MTQPPAPPGPPDDAWPTPDDATIIQRRETVVDPPGPVLPPPDRRIGAGMLLALGALALIAVGILIAYLLTHRDHKQNTTTVVVTTQPATTASVAAKVAVPDLTRMSFADAQTKLNGLGLVAKQVEVSSSQPAGTVVDQSPKSGADTAKGSTVTLSVARAQATTGATTTTTTTTPTTTAATTSTTTSPAPPTHPANATMPDVQGQTEQAAVTALNKAGILASLVFVPGTDPLGTVVQQAKPSGTTLPFHSHVQINFSKGPNAQADVTVPNVIGQTLTQAVSTLNGANLRLIFVKIPVTSHTQAGKVVQQSPLASGTAPGNAQVLVFLGAFQTG